MLFLLNKLLGKKSDTMRKTLFIIPNKLADIPEHLIRDISGPKIIPYGILSCIAYIKANTHIDIEFKVLDLNTKSGDSEGYENIIAKTLVDFKPDVVGISVLFNNLVNQLFTISSIVKNTMPECIVVAGGTCASNDYKSILGSTENIDGICYSEGEIPLMRLLSAEDMHKQLNDDPSFVTKDSLFKGRVPTVSFINDLDQIPFLDYSYINVKSYDPYPCRTMNITNDDVAMSIHTTRGCPFNCIFCCAANVHGKSMRYMSEKYVLDFVNYMVDNYGLSILTIEDDNFLVDKKRAKKILEGLLLLKQQGKLNGVSIITVAVAYIDEEIVALFKALDISNLSIATEHGTEYMLNRIIKKPCSLDQIKRVVELLKKYDVKYSATIVMGLPGEREIDRLEAVKFYLELGVDWVAINIAMPLKGSRLYELCIEKGYIDPKDLDIANVRTSIINTPDISASEITEKAYLMNLELNFVHNYRMRIGDYESAITRFSDLAKRHKDHAFAHYCLAEAYKGVGNKNKYSEQLDCFFEIVNRVPKWKEYALHFGILN